MGHFGHLIHSLKIKLLVPIWSGNLQSQQAIWINSGRRFDFSAQFFGGENSRPLHRNVDDIFCLRLLFIFVEHQSPRGPQNKPKTFLKIISLKNYE